MRVLVTGVGIVSPLGVGARHNLRAMLEGRSAIQPLDVVQLAGAKPAPAAQCRDLDLCPGMSRADAMALGAAREALADAGLDRPARRAMHLFVGGTTAGMHEAEETLARLTADPEHDDFDRACIPGHVLSAPADRVHEELGPFAATRSICSACSGGAAAIALAAASLRAGRCELALAGGVDALCRMNIAGFGALAALDGEPCRPFDTRREGLSLGEGAAFLVLELESAACARGAQIVAELAGWAIASEAHHITQPARDGSAVIHTMQSAIARAGLEAVDVDYVNAHGTATPHNDPIESQAIAATFGSDIAVSSLKGHIGHGLAAAGAIEAAVTALVVDEGCIPPTVGLEEIDPRCNVVRHVRSAEHRPVGAAISNAFGFGGTDVVLAFRRRDVIAALPVPIAPDAIVVTAISTLGPLGLSADPLAYAGASPDDRPVELPIELLDPMARRRFDRASRLATIVSQEALRSIVGRDGEAAAPPRARTGIIVGSAFGSVSATGSFLLRLFDKGPRFARPADFPTVLPSALSSHPSIYLGLEGPALSCSDLGASAESALDLGLLLIADGQADAMVVVGVEEHSPAAPRVSSRLVSGLTGLRGEGAAALVIERAASARARGVTPLAVVRHGVGRRGDIPAVAGPEGRIDRALVVSARDRPPPPSWAHAPFCPITGAGSHESVGAFALAAAVSACATGVADEALVLGGAPDRGYAFVLAGPRPEQITRP
jgi:3-oxoacyl-[acyl-carrier-protein] synthase II